MLMQIFSNTPKWVFALFVALLWLGLQQMLPRRVGLGRATILPIAMTGLSLYGVTSAFGDSPQALLTWLAGAMLAFTVCLSQLSTANTRYDAERRQFTLPASATPLALFMGIFFTKYAVGVSIGMQPALAHDTSFALTVSALYGAFSGIFMARTAKLLRLALGQSWSLQPQMAPK